MSEIKNEVKTDERNIVEQKEASKEKVELLSPEEIEILKNNAKLIEDFGKYLGNEDLGKEWKRKLEQGTDEEISKEYRKLGALSEIFKKFLRERIIQKQLNI